MFLQIVALLLAVAADPPAWKIEVTTTGGFAGQGSGSLTAAADGFITIRPGCRLRLAADDLKAIGELVDKAKPREWKPSYVVPTNPNGCCDMIGTTLTITRRGSKWTSTWFDDHLPLPADLEAIVDAVWKPVPTTIRGRYKAQCKP
jgi:hypothetical protein